MKKLNSWIAAFLSTALLLLISCGQAPEPNRFREQNSAPASAFDPARDGELAGADEIRAADLPNEARHLLQLIHAGGPFPYPKDGSVFGNREGRLPHKPRGYYHEYTVETPGARNRGARRIISGNNGELYYSDDHYLTFGRILEK
jgi:ribonuclease T1